MLVSQDLVMCGYPGVRLCVLVVSRGGRVLQLERIIVLIERELLFGFLMKYRVVYLYDANDPT